MRFIFATYFILFSSLCFSKTTADSSLLKQKTLKAHRIQSEIHIDGDLSEAEWHQAERAKDFIENFPTPGNHLRYKTEVAVLYDDEAMYIAGWCFDPAPDSILRQLTQRDVIENSDVFNIGIDTYNDNQNTFEFSVQASGVQVDARGSTNNYDVEWNAVWLSVARVTDFGWAVEIKIPFSSIRFSASSTQPWGINFSRNIRRHREIGFWSYTDPRISGNSNQYGDLVGIENVQSPLRLSLIPYASTYYTRYDDSKTNTHEGAFTYNAGMDLKYGLNDAFTLDMTLIPDFGQVQSDNIIFNTSPFEVQYNEFRQFFTEGTELFNKANIFYSRRVGGFPVNYGAAYDSLRGGESVIKNPTATRTLNATKISGRTKGGTGIGIFNGISAASFATLEDSLGNQREIETNPLTNYNLIVLDQNLKNNSFVNLTNGSVLRNGSTYDANVTSLSTNLNTEDNEYGINAQGVLSQQYYPGVKPVLGHFGRISAGKNNGNFTFNLGYSERSNTYDPNDIAYLDANNKRGFDLNLNYNQYEPKGRLLNSWLGVSLYQSRIYSPNAMAETGLYSWAGCTTKKWFTWGLDFGLVPFKSYDYFEPRVAGRVQEKNEYSNLNLFLSTDYRKRFAIDVTLWGMTYFNTQWNSWQIRVRPRFRFSDKFMLIHSTNLYSTYNEEASALDRFGSPTIFGDTIIFARRNGTLVENVLDLRYIFTNRMALSFRCRHYWYSSTYSSFHLLQTDGTLGYTTYNGEDAVGNSLHDNNFNAFNIDMVYTWVFAPGSELRVVWKGSIYSDLESTVKGYFPNLQGTLESGKTNSISVKLLYYLDVNRFKRKNPKN